MALSVIREYTARVRVMKIWTRAVFSCGPVRYFHVEHNSTCYFYDIIV